MILRRFIQHIKDQNWFAVGLDVCVVIVGIFLGMQVTDWNDERIEQQLADEYLSGFQQDLMADAQMLAREISGREAQLGKALTVLEFYEGRSLDLNAFFGAYYPSLVMRQTQPNRNTMDEVLNSGGLRLIRNRVVRSGLMDLYVTYDRIRFLEEHMARDFDKYLYDTTFSSVPMNFEGPWEDTQDNRRIAETLMGNVAIENGFRLAVINLQSDSEIQGLLVELALARTQVNTLLATIQMVRNGDSVPMEDAAP